jgi:agmatinase
MINGKRVYITLDVDGLDPNVMPATGTPVSGGLSWSFTRQLLQSIFLTDNVIGADVVEVVAGLD